MKKLAAALSFLMLISALSVPTHATSPIFINEFFNHRVDKDDGIRLIRKNDYSVIGTFEFNEYIDNTSLCLRYTDYVDSTQYYYVAGNSTSLTRNRTYGGTIFIPKNMSLNTITEIDINGKKTKLFKLYKQNENIYANINDMEILLFTSNEGGFIDYEVNLNVDDEVIDITINNNQFKLSFTSKKLHLNDNIFVCTRFLNDATTVKNDVNYYINWFEYEEPIGVPLYRICNNNLFAITELTCTKVIYNEDNSLTFSKETYPKGRTTLPDDNSKLFLFDSLTNIKPLIYY